MNHFRATEKFGTQRSATLEYFSLQEIGEGHLMSDPGWHVFNPEREKFQKNDQKTAEKIFKFYIVTQGFYVCERD